MCLCACECSCVCVCRWEINTLSVVEAAVVALSSLQRLIHLRRHDSPSMELINVQLVSQVNYLARPLHLWDFDIMIEIMIERQICMHTKVLTTKYADTMMEAIIQKTPYR